MMRGFSALPPVPRGQPPIELGSLYRVSGEGELRGSGKGGEWFQCTASSPAGTATHRARLIVQGEWRGGAEG